MGLNRDSPAPTPCLIFDPGGLPTPEVYCRRYTELDPIIIQFVASMNASQDAYTTLAPNSLRAKWQWMRACDDAPRDSLLPINPGYIRYMYHEWSHSFMQYPVPMAVDLLFGSIPSTNPSTSTAESSLQAPPPLPGHILERVEAALELATFLRDAPVNRERTIAFFSQALTVADRDYSIQDAVSVGDNFQLPTEELLRDVRRLVSSGGDLVHLARHVQHERSHGRLSIHRIDLSLDRRDIEGSTPRLHLSPSLKLDFARLARLAHHGIKLPTYDGFTPTSATTSQRRIRPLYKQVHQCVNRSVVDLFRDHLVLLLPTVFILRLMLYHQTPIGWTTKESKKEGRTLFDAKDSRGSSSLNPTVDDNKHQYTEDLRAEWGSIQHADLRQICEMILEFEATMAGRMGSSFSLRDVVLFKVDLSRAFHLLSFAAESVPLLTSELYQTVWPEFSTELCELLTQLGVDITPESTRSFSMVYITGSFGLILLPFVFGVVTRCLLYLLLRAIHGRLVSYVDDSMGVTLKNYLHHDICAICEVIELLLGPQAVEYKKWFFGRQIVMIGWKVDLDLRCISLSSKNLLKVAYGFTVTDLEKKVKVRWVTKLASWSSRYTQVLRALHPCTVSLFAMVCGMNNMDAEIDWKADAKVSVLIWRAALVLLHLYEEEYCLPLDYFIFMVITYEIEYDASLTGIGYLLFRLANGMRTELIGCGYVRFPFSCRSKSDFQNTCEFIAVLIGVLNLAQLGIRDTSIRLCGDSKTSLSWGLDGHFRGKLCQKAALVYILATTLFNIVVTEAIHIPGEHNVICDRLSRQKATANEYGISYRVLTDLSTSTVLHSFLTLVDPTTVTLLDTEASFRAFWRSAHDLLLRLSTDGCLHPCSRLSH